eukprot:7577121-Pyramimonas_sp.AAC.1
MCSGCTPPSMVAAVMSAPAFSSASTAAACPLMAAQWSGVMPSGLRRLTFAPAAASAATPAAQRGDQSDEGR